jgi:hypothetical protein
MLSPSLEEPDITTLPRSGPRSGARSGSLFDSADFGQRRQMRLAIELAVTQVFGVDHEALERVTRGIAKVALARQVAMYLAHVGCGLSQEAAGNLFRRDRRTVAHACLIIEDRRNNPMFDHALNLLEWMVPVMVLRPGPFLLPS